MKKLENKVAVVTGGNSGIGLSTAKLFAAQGAKVVITGRNQTTIDSAIKEIGHNAIGLVSDTANLESIDALFEQVKNTFGKIDVLVLNAGIYSAGSIADFTEEQFDQLINTNFKGLFFSVKKSLPYLNDGASIILTGSTAAKKAFPGIAVYSATKAAVHSLAKTLSAELLERGIRVNVLAPGPIDTPIFDRNGMTKEEVDATKAAFAGHVPIKRLGRVEEMAEGFLYLASDDSKFMVGGELMLDGGVGTF